MVLCVVKYKNISLCSFCTMWFYIFAQIYRIAFSHIVCIISHTGNTPVICLCVFIINSCKILACISGPDMLHLTHQAYIFLYLQFKQSYILYY